MNARDLDSIVLQRLMKKNDPKFISDLKKVLSTRSEPAVLLYELLKQAVTLSNPEIALEIFRVTEICGKRDALVEALRNHPRNFLGNALEKQKYVYGSLLEAFAELGNLDLFDRGMGYLREGLNFDQAGVQRELRWVYQVGAPNVDKDPRSILSILTTNNHKAILNLLINKKLISTTDVFSFFALSTMSVDTADSLLTKGAQINLDQILFDLHFIHNYSRNNQSAFQDQIIDKMIWVLEKGAAIIVIPENLYAHEFLAHLQSRTRFKHSNLAYLHGLYTERWTTRTDPHSDEPIYPEEKTKAQELRDAMLCYEEAALLNNRKAIIKMAKIALEEKNYDAAFDWCKLCIVESKAKKIKNPLNSVPDLFNILIKLLNHYARAQNKESQTKELLCYIVSRFPLSDDNILLNVEDSLGLANFISRYPEVVKHKIPNPLFAALALVRQVYDKIDSDENLLRKAHQDFEHLLIEIIKNENLTKEETVIFQHYDRPEFRYLVLQFLYQNIGDHNIKRAQQWCDIALQIPNILDHIILSIEKAQKNEPSESKEMKEMKNVLNYIHKHRARYEPYLSKVIWQEINTILQVKHEEKSKPRSPLIQKSLFYADVSMAFSLPDVRATKPLPSGRVIKPGC